MSDQNPVSPDLEALRKLHKRITHCRYNGVDLVFRKPRMDEAQLYRSMSSDTAEERFEQISTLAQMILVHPDVGTWHTLMDDYPFMLSSEPVNEAISVAMGVREEKKGSTAPAKPKTPTPSASPAASPSGSPSAHEAS